MLNLIKKYLKKKDLEVVNAKEYNNILKYRSARGDLKRVISDYNELLQLFVDNASSKVLKELLDKKSVEYKNLSKEDIQKLVVDTYKEEFKKN